VSESWAGPEHVFNSVSYVLQVSGYRPGGRLELLVRYRCYCKQAEFEVYRVGYWSKARCRSHAAILNPDLCLQAYSLYHGRPVSDADFQPRRTRYENTGQLQLLHRSYQYGTPTNNPTLGNARLSHTNTQDVDIQELTQQLKVPLYKQLIGNTAMVDLSSLSANPQVCFAIGLVRVCLP